MGLIYHAALEYSLIICFMDYRLWNALLPVFCLLADVSKIKSTIFTNRLVATNRRIATALLENLPNNTWWCRCCLTIFLKVFWPQDSTIFCNSPAVVLGESPSHCALGRYRQTSSSRQFHNILCWLEILNYCPDGGNGNFHCSSSFLKVTSLICEAQLYFRNIL